MKLEDKVALVTGAASGIGRAIALRYAAAGARVAVADLQRDPAQAVVEEVRAAGSNGMAVAMDVTDEAAVNEGVEATVRAYGRIDVLVSNAGIQIVHPLEDFSYAEWK